MTRDDRLIYQLSRAHYRLNSYLQKELLDKKARITQAQAGILFLLEKGPLKMTDISKRLDIDNSAITGLVDRLEKAGLASRKTNPADRRTFLIEISPKGRTEIDRARPIIKEVNREIKAGFSDEEIESFKRVLNSLYTKFKNRSPTKNKVAL